MCLNETYSRVRVGKHLSDLFPIRNGFKLGEALPPLRFNFISDYAIMGAQVSQMAGNEMVHISFWFMLMMLIYWAEVYIL
jgi:hypothetical protein